ncbi:hypothetical protein EJB05_27662, partial [Eragrostis curvula]
MRFIYRLYEMAGRKGIRIGSQSGHPQKQEPDCERKRSGNGNQGLEQWDNECYICKDGGTLLLCDFRNCTKAYHFQCVGKDADFANSEEPWFCDNHPVESEAIGENEIINIEDDLPEHTEHQPGHDDYNAIQYFIKPKHNYILYRRVWCYMDPQGNEQGPVSMDELRYWKEGGFFEEDFKIWKQGRAEETTIFLRDALLEKTLTLPTMHPVESEGVCGVTSILKVMSKDQCQWQSCAIGRKEASLKKTSKSGNKGGLKKLLFFLRDALLVIT